MELDASESKSRFRIRLLIGVILALFAAQIVYLAKAEEPYPALMMPRFGWAGPPQIDGLDVTEVDIVFHYADATTAHASVSELMSMAPSGHRLIIVNTLLSPLDVSARPRRAPDGKLVPPEWLFPGYGLARISRQDPEHRRGLAAWLARRARSFHAGTPSLCEALWYQSKYKTDASGQPIRASRKLTGTFQIDLHDALETTL